MPFEIIPFDKQRVGMMIAEVSDKGLPTSLIMALSWNVIRISATGFSTPSEAIAFANSIIIRDSKTGMIVTVFYRVLDNTVPSITYVNIGQNQPLLIRAGPVEAEELEATGIAIGAMDDASYVQKEVPLASGDLLILYTDGVIEAVNDKEEMFEKTRLMDIVLVSHSLTTQEIVDVIITGVNDFGQNQPQYDNITLMVVKVT